MAVDILTLLRDRDPDHQKCADLISWVNESLENGNFSVVLGSLRQAVQQQVIPARAAETVLQLDGLSRCS